MEIKKGCRPGCAACCVAPSITTPILGMPTGKPAGERCFNLTSDNRCSIHEKAEYPPFCRGLKFSEEMCGNSQEQAMNYLAELEKKTADDVGI